MINEFIEDSLKNIKFLDRYIILSNKNQRVCDDYIKTDKNILINLFKNLGYPNVKYFSKDKYYEIENILISKDITIGLNFYIRYEEADFVLNIESSLGKIDFNGPFGLLCQKLGNDQFVRRPCFCSDIELDDIIVDCISMYEDLKLEIIKTFLGGSESFL